MSEHTHLECRLHEVPDAARTFAISEQLIADFRPCFASQSSIVKGLETAVFPPSTAAGLQGLMFWFCSNLISPHNVISPHKQGSFDFSRTRLAFFRDLPD